MPPILVVAAFLRFWKLPDRGLLYWDEGKFALEGLRFLALSQHLLGGHESLTLGKAVGTAKPGHALLVSVSYALFGVHDYAALYVNAACSVASVAVTFAIGARLAGAWAGAAAALLLAVAEYDVIYARSALSESDAELIFLLATLIWLGGWGSRNREARPAHAGRIAAVGFLCGCAFTVNYRAIVYVAVLVGADIGLGLRGDGFVPSVRRVVIWVASLIATPLCWQLVDWVARSRGEILFVNEVVRSPTSYLAEAAYQLHQGKQSVLRFEPEAYLQWYVVRQGWLALAMLVLALLFAAGVRRAALMIPAAFVVIPYALYAVAPFVVPRNLDTAIPFTCLLIAILVTAPLEVLRPTRSLAAGICACLALLVAFQLPGAWRVTAVRSGLAGAARYLGTRGARRAIVANEVMVFYLRGGAGPCLAPRVPYSRDQLASDMHFGFRWAVLDRYSGSSLDRLIKSRLRPAASFAPEGSPRLGESLIDSENTLRPGSPPEEHSVRVYDLRTLGLTAPPHPRFPGCDRNFPP